MAYAVDPLTRQVWSRSVAELPSAVAEQLRSTNTNNVQVGDVLYIVGGYGYAASLDEHISHPRITAIDVPGFLAALQDGSPLTPHVRSLADEQFAVAGGQLAWQDDVFYLVGGHRFDGLYNPMGHATHTQTYTDAIRRFTLTDDGSSLAINWLPTWTNTTLLHRRDYNLVPQVFPDGTAGWTLFSGVFQRTADLPFLSVIDIKPTGYAERAGFSQYLSHYHSAWTAFYSSAEARMHSLFFGGIAEYTLDAGGNLVQDLDVPFVRTISRVTQAADGSTAEYALPVSMPGWLGAGAVFMPADVPETVPGIVDLDALRASAAGDSVLLGWVVGGIRSTAPNVFWTDNDGTLSDAEDRVFQVWWHPEAPTGLSDQINSASQETLRLQVYPNPSSGAFRASFELSEPAPVRLRAFAPDGTLLADREFGRLAAGAQDLPMEFSYDKATLFILELQAGEHTAVQVVVANP
jgi:hypothetical protein